MAVSRLSEGDRAAIRRLVDRLHVSATSQDVEDEFLRLLEPTSRASSETITRGIAYAKRHHAENRKLFLAVQRGELPRKKRRR